MWKNVKKVLLLGAVPVAVAGCAMPTAIPSALSATDRMLAYVLDSMFSPELKPMDPGYPGFFRDVTSELQFHCKAQSCSHPHFGWGSEVARANFVTKCATVKGDYLGCDHFKQMWGDTKIYPAGSSVFSVVSGKLEMVAFELRGENGEKLALRQGGYDQSYTGMTRTRASDPVIFRPPETVVAPEVASRHSEPVPVRSETAIPVAVGNPVTANRSALVATVPRPTVRNPPVPQSHAVPPYPSSPKAIPAMMVEKRPVTAVRSIPKAKPSETKTKSGESAGNKKPKKAEVPKKTKTKTNPTRIPAQKIPHEVLRAA